MKLRQFSPSGSRTKGWRSLLFFPLLLLASIAQPQSNGLSGEAAGLVEQTLEVFRTGERLPVLTERIPVRRVEDLCVLAETGEEATRAAALYLIVRADPDAMAAAEAVQRLISYLQSTQPHVRVMAALALSYHGYVDDRVLDVLAKAATGAQGTVRHEALMALGSLGSLAAPVLPDLSEELLRQERRDSFWAYEQIHEAFWEILTKLNDVPPLDIPTPKEPEEKAGSWMLAYLARYGAKPEQARAQLLSIVENRESVPAPARLAAVAAYADVLAWEDRDANTEKDPGENRRLAFFLQLLNDREEKDVWPVVMDELAKMGKVAAPAAPRLRSLSRSQDIYVSAQALAALLSICPEQQDVMEELMALPEHAFEIHRSRMIGTLVTYYEDDPAIHSSARVLLYGLPVESHEVLRALHELDDPAKGFVPDLLQQLRRRHRTREEVSLIVGLLSKWEIEEGYRSILMVLFSGEEWQSRRAAVEALAAFPGHRSETNLALYEARRDPSPYVRQAALKAMVKMMDERQDVQSVH